MVPRDAKDLDMTQRRSNDNKSSSQKAPYVLDSTLKTAHHTKNKDELKLNEKRQIDRYQHQDVRDVELSDKDFKQSYKEASVAYFT